MRTPFTFEVGSRAYVSEQSLERLRQRMRQDPTVASLGLFGQLQRFLGHIGEVVHVDGAFKITVEFYAGAAGVTQRFELDETGVDPICNLPAPHTERTSDGRGRIAYDPTFDFQKPWKVVVEGTVISHAATRELAQERLREKGVKW